MPKKLLQAIAHVIFAIAATGLILDVGVVFHLLDLLHMIFFFFSSRRRHTRFDCDWSSDVCSSDLLAVVPVLREFRDRMEAVRAAELERTLRRLPHLSPEDRGQIEYFSQALLNKFLHQPTVALKEAARAGRGYGLLDALKRLFGLERRDGT